MLRHREHVAQKPPMHLTVIAAILLFLLAPQPHPSILSPEILLLIPICGAIAAWLLSSVGALPVFLTSIPIGILAYISSGGSMVSVICSLLYLIPALAYFLVSQKRVTRSSAVGVSALLLSVIVITLLLCPVWKNHGSITSLSIQDSYKDFFSQLTDTLKKSFTVTVAGKDVPYVSDINAHHYINVILGMMPGLIGCLAILVGYLCGVIYRFLLSVTHGSLPDAVCWKLRPLPVTVLVFLIALVTALISQNVHLIWLVAINLCLLLCPEFCLSGLVSVFEVRYINGLPYPRIFRGIFLLIGMLNGFGGMLIVTMVLGVLDGIIAAIPRKKKEI